MPTPIRDPATGQIRHASEYPLVPDGPTELDTYLEIGWEIVGENQKPAQAARKDEWVDYAVSQGYDEAEGLTKDELIERYG